jgi:hypothetical protein
MQTTQSTSNLPDLLQPCTAAEKAVYCDTLTQKVSLHICGRCKQGKHTMLHASRLDQPSVYVMQKSSSQDHINLDLTQQPTTTTTAAPALNIKLGNIYMLLL